MTADVQRWLALAVVLGAGVYLSWRGWRAARVARAARTGCGRGPGCGCE
ncbi:MAG TPA: hypothetical protein VF761_08125 [Gemmatimonadaceae bacterium]